MIILADKDTRLLFVADLLAFSHDLRAPLFKLFSLLSESIF